MKRILLSQPYIRSNEKKRVLDVLNSGVIASGPQVKILENMFEHTLKAKNAIAVSNGTVSLFVSLSSLGIGQNDKVITTPFSFIASSNSVLQCGAKPIFVDIDEKTFNLDPNNVEDVLKKQKNIKAILVVHLYGLPAQMSSFKFLAKKYNVKLIEDCAQAIGATFNGRHVGTFGDTGSFSMYATKNIMSAEGGVVSVGNNKLAKKMRAIINHGRTGRFTHSILGYNFRLTDIQAAIGIEQMKSLNEFTNKRIKNAEYYNKLLKNINWITLPHVPKNIKHVFHQYTIIVPKNKRDKLIDYLNKKFINAAAIYPITIPEQVFYKKMGYKALPISAKVSRQVVCLPVHPMLSKKDLDRIISVIKEFKI